MKTKFLIVIILFFLLLINNCREDDNFLLYPHLEQNENIPVVLNSTNIFTFSITANKYSNNFTERLYFNTDSIFVTIVLKNIKADSSFIEIYNQNDELLLEKSLTSDLVLHENLLMFKIPYYIKMQLLNFTGNMTFVISNKTNNNPPN